MWTWVAQPIHTAKSVVVASSRTSQKTPTSTGFLGRPVQGTTHPRRIAGGKAPGLTRPIPPPSPAARRRVSAAHPGESGESSTDAAKIQDGMTGLQALGQADLKGRSSSSSGHERRPRPILPQHFDRPPAEGVSSEEAGLAITGPGGRAGVARREQRQLPIKDPDSRNLESALELFLSLHGVSAFSGFVFFLFLNINLVSRTQTPRPPHPIIRVLHAAYSGIKHLQEPEEI